MGFQCLKHLRIKARTNQIRMIKQLYFKCYLTLRRYKANKRPAQQTNDVPEGRPKKAAKAPKPYVPTLRSGPYALLMGLSTLDEDTSGLTKTELIEVSQEHCDSSFTAPTDPTKFYTAWNSMKTLIQKDIVYEYGRPTRRYLLTEEGWEIAKRMRNITAEKSATKVCSSLFFLASDTST